MLKVTLAVSLIGALLFACACGSPFAAKGEVSSEGQDTMLFLHGSVRDYMTSLNLTEFSVRATDFDDAAFHLAGSTSGDGTFELPITEIRHLLISFDSPGYMTKSVEIRMNGPLLEEWQEGFGGRIDISLIKEISGTDLSFLKEPIGRLRFDDSLRSFEWDLDYTAQIRQRIALAMEEYDRLQSRGASIRDTVP